MKTTEPFTLQQADWATHADELYAIRRLVFVEEQHVPEDLEHDEFDTVSRHIIARDAAGHGIGTGRLLPDGHIGRLAVLREWRGRGVGLALMDNLLTLARTQGFAEVVLNAQTYVLDFYRQLGFVEEGEEFFEAGLPHLAMRRRLEP